MPYQTLPTRINKRVILKSKRLLSKPQPNHPGNVKRLADARNRIQTAYSEITHQITILTTIGDLRKLIVDEIFATYGIIISNQTIHKHKDIWHPRHNS
jgi:hypothetical protein